MNLAVDADPCPPLSSVRPKAVYTKYTGLRVVHDLKTSERQWLQFDALLELRGLGNVGLNGAEVYIVQPPLVRPESGYLSASHLCITLRYALRTCSRDGGARCASKPCTSLDCLLVVS